MYLSSLFRLRLSNTIEKDTFNMIKFETVNRNRHLSKRFQKHSDTLITRDFHTIYFRSQVRTLKSADSRLLPDEKYFSYVE